MSGQITNLSDALERKTVTYPNRYGFTITGELYYAKEMNLNARHPALIVGAPYYVKEISPRPILFVVGDRAHSRFFSEDAYAAANEPKELYVVEDAEHIDLYDRVDRIPFEKLTEFFQKNLNDPQNC